MKVKLISFVLVVLSIDNFVLSEKYQYIGDCLLKNEQNQRHLTFVCVSSSQRNNLFDIYGTVRCSKQGLYLWKSDINSIDFTECHQPQIPDTLFERFRNVRVFDLSNLGLELLNTNGFDQLTELYVSQNELAKIPADTFAGANKLIEVDLSFNKIIELNENAFVIENKVETLNLAHNDMQVIPVNTFHRLIKLKRLLFSHNQIEAIPSLLFLRSEHLIEIDFSFNKIGEIDEFAFDGDFHLEKMNLSHNQLHSLTPEVMASHINLKKFDVSFNQITVLNPESLKNLQNLELLDFSNNLIEKLYSTTFVNLTKLQHLYLARNRLSEILLGTFQHLIMLETLDLSSNQLKALHSNSFALRPTQLKLLSIANNQLRTMDGITSSLMPNVKIIGMDSNQFSCSFLREFFKTITWQQIASISKRIKCSGGKQRSQDLFDEIRRDFVSLGEDLKFRMKHAFDAERVYIIKAIPSFLFLKCDKLIEIDFSFNKISIIDDYAFAGDFNLEKLNLSHNHPKSLNSAITEFHSILTLNQLDVSFNEIDFLKPDTLEKCENSVLLNLSGNLLQKLNTHMFDKLVKLEHLYLSGTNLSELPSGTFAALIRLELLDLSNNTLKTLDIDILPYRPNQLKLLSIANNQLQELKNFTGERIPNAKIDGIDSNQFSCSYLKTFFKSITWKQLHSISVRLDCNSGVKRTEIYND
ncbi:protein artichoke-like, partial [Sitodiplosis mosellana]|uniref:protein artichoke-like n=1 Tax=Sitodiplosis mosellana TaxID=263140 RepID=UPI00244421E3